MTTGLRARVDISVPDNAFAQDVPLVAVMRGDAVGSLHRGTLAVADPAGDVSIALGDPRQAAFLRSSAKPFQLIPALLTGAIDRFGITDEQLAVLAASHSAQDYHQRAVLSVLDKAGLKEDALRCGVHPPLHEQTARKRFAAGLAPSPVCNNCSGAHAGMLTACRAAGWNIETYGQPSHPLQRLTLEVLSSFSGEPVSEIRYAVDNCAVPTFLLPVGSAATAFARLATGEQVPPDMAAAARRIVTAMVGHPHMVAGEARFDTDLMTAAAGTIVAKGGAEGFHGIGLRDLKLGLALKISDGSPRAGASAALAVLEHLGALQPESAASLANYAHPEVTNHQGELVGRLNPLFHFRKGT